MPYITALLKTILAWVSWPYRKLRSWLEKRRKRRAAAQKLAEFMGVGSHPDHLPKDTRADKNVQRVARRMVETAPQTTAGSDAAGDPVVLYMEDAHANGANSTAESKIDPALQDVMLDEGGYLESALVGDNDSSTGRTNRQRADNHLTAVLEPFKQRDLTDTSALNFDKNELFLDDTVLPRPRRSEVKKADHTVRGYWETNPNADEEVQRAARFPLVDRQIRTVVEHLITSRPKIQGPTDQTEIVRKWFEIDLEVQSNHKLSLHQFVEDIADQLLRYGSCPVFKIRTQSGKTKPYSDPRTTRKRAPLWGYKIPDVSTVQAFIDLQGRPRRWRQDPALYHDGDAKTYKDEDVFLAGLPIRNSAMYFWTPSLVTPVLYAINVLRDLHETIESHTKNIVDIPAYAQVGDQKYAQGQVTASMLQKVSALIRKAKRGAMLVVPWYVEFSKHESEEYVDQLLDAAEFWETIVRRGIGGSKLQDGEPSTSNRNTADVLAEDPMRTAQALVPVIQRAFRWLIIDKLFENGVALDDIKSHDDMVSLEFEDIDLSKQMARESHVNLLWQNDALTHAEYRKRLGEDPDPERKDMYYSDIQHEKEQELEKTKKEVQQRARPNGKARPKRKKE